MKPLRAAGQTPGSAAAAQRSAASQPSARHGTRRHAAGAPPALPGKGSAAFRRRHSSARAETEPLEPGEALYNRRPAPAVGNPGEGLVPVRQKGMHCTGMLLLVPTSGASMHENIVGHLWEFQTFGLVLHERSSHTSPRPGHQGHPASLRLFPKPAGTCSRPREEPTGTLWSLAWRQRAPPPLGGMDPLPGAAAVAPREPTVRLLADSSIISIQLLFARGSCNQRPRAYSGKINHNC